MQHNSKIHNNITDREILGYAGQLLNTLTVVELGVIIITLFMTKNRLTFLNVIKAESDKRLKLNIKKQNITAVNKIYTISLKKT